MVAIYVIMLSMNLIYYLCELYAIIAQKPSTIKVEPVKASS
jgi:hypothetical protein